VRAPYLVSCQIVFIARPFNEDRGWKIEDRKLPL